ncbi:hypothetical protein [Mangrovicoccus ximenensis]|uniref:hypothetical protein n=1 Tax=Mangrovicoccus ximenensis TaxID=1911570 RepID=UPI000D3392F3|nr:hypothetical protein [Mangrovicoccus ximenensis]
MAQPAILWVIVRGSFDNAGPLKWLRLGNGQIPEAFRAHVESLAAGSKAIVPDLEMGFLSTAAPQEVAAVLSRQIGAAFAAGNDAGQPFGEVRIAAYSAGAPILRYALARGRGPRAARWSRWRARPGSTAPGAS